MGTACNTGVAPYVCVIPANLFDPNAVRELNAGTFPKPNFGTSQYISSIPQPTNVREDVVRIDHKINSKLQLMAHYLHDQVSQTYYPPLWGSSTYPTVGNGHGESLLVFYHQAHADALPFAPQRDRLPIQRKYAEPHTRGHGDQASGLDRNELLSRRETTSACAYLRFSWALHTAPHGAQTIFPWKKLLHGISDP